MKNTASLIITAALVAIGATLLPSTVAAHGGDPHDMADAMAMSMERPMTMRGGGTLTIAHVQDGCHVWSRRSASAPGVKVILERGQRLTVLNQDLDAHRLVRVRGPKIALGKTMTTNDRVTLRFRTKGVYKLRTEKAQMPAMPEIETTGPDNVLVMLVVVR